MSDHDENKLEFDQTPIFRSEKNLDDYYPGEWE